MGLLTCAIRPLRFLLETPSLRWSMCFVFVVMAYAGTLWFALNWQETDVVNDAAPMAAMMIELAPIPVAPVAPANVVDPSPEQEEAPPPPPEPIPEPEPEPEIEPIPESPVVEKAEAVLPKEPPPEPIPEPETIQEQAAQENKAPPTFEAPPDEVAAAPKQGAVSLVPSQATTTWQSTLLGHLERHKRYPRRARRKRQEAIVYVSITIDRDGRVLESQLTQPSDYAILNKATLKMIERAQPLPPPPPEVTGETVTFVVPVEYFLRG